VKHIVKHRSITEPQQFCSNVMRNVAKQWFSRLFRLFGLGFPVLVFNLHISLFLLGDARRKDALEPDSQSLWYAEALCVQDASVCN